MRFFVAASLALFSIATAHAADALSRTEVEKIVHDYIVAHGEVIQKGLEQHAMRERFKLMQDVVRPHTPTRGPADAKVTVVEFSDFECPFCSRVQPTVTTLWERYGDRVRFAYKHLPLTALHPGAEGAARASQAAARQGKFWEFRDQLFKRQQFSGERMWQDVAKELELDVDKFNEDRKSEEVRKEVATDAIDGEKVGARGTPFFLINGTVLSGAQPLDAFVDIIEDHLRQADAAAGNQ